jgi:tetratricopeptide (TPR) repeat protein
MSHSVVRLTLYSVISAIEGDFRRLIRTQILPNTSYDVLFTKDLLDILRDRAARDGSDDSPDLLSYLDYADTINTLHAGRHFLDSSAQKLLKSLNSRLAKLTPVRNRVMHSRPLQYTDYSFTIDLVSSLLTYPTHLFPDLSHVEAKLKDDPAYVLSIALPSQIGIQGKQNHNLPLPDFDETGFLGRAEETRQLLTAIRGPWPIVTIIGEGGVGKTALALRIAYELLDDTSASFDAIVWTSSKTTRLTPNEIRKIDGAIQDSLGILRDIEHTLSGTTSADPVSEILEYMNSFRIFLVLDNLETILDQRVRFFLSRLSGSSKILITSRVGLGELEFRYPLSSMPLADATQLLRSTAIVRGVTPIAKMKVEMLRSYCRRMKNNAAFIKWFVSLVQIGKRPEDVLQHPALLLDYCFANVYEYLGSPARHVAKALLAVPGKHTQAVISYLADIRGDTLSTAIQELIITNMITLNVIEVSEVADMCYDLSELSRSYLMKHHPLPAKELEGFRARKAQINALHERYNETIAVSRYLPNSISIRTRDDVVVAKYLLDALANVRSKDFPRAFELVELAEELAPAYYEVHRVKGWAHTYAGNIPAAQEAYEAAVELEPKSAALRFWYGGFLLRYVEELTGAIEQFKVALSLDPDAIPVQSEVGRCMMYMGRYEEAGIIFETITRSETATTKELRIAYDSSCQVSSRQAYSFLEGGEYLPAFGCFAQLFRKYDEVPASIKDRQIISTITRALPQLRRLWTVLEGSDEAEKVGEWVRFVTKLAYGPVGDQGTIAEGRIGIYDLLYGRVERFAAAGTFGFIFGDDGAEYFFHRRNLVPGLGITMLRVGDRVSFRLGTNEKGTVADGVSLVVERAAAGVLE